VEIVVQGSYLDLLSYVSRLERQSWQVYWGKTVLTAEYPKTVVALTLYTLSLDKAWLVV
jgi:MSHA biogenesis protein MshJ